MPHFRAFGVGGEVQAASRRLIGDRMHGITDRTSGVVAAEQKRSVVRTHEVRDLRRVEYWRNFHEQPHRLPVTSTSWRRQPGCSRSPVRHLSTVAYGNGRRATRPERSAPLRIYGWAWRRWS